MAWQGNDRRKFPRILYPCMIKIFSSEQGQEVMLTHTENVGVGGCCIIVKKAIQLFSPVSVELDLIDEADHIRAEGKVVWSVRRKAVESFKPSFYDIGIEFANVSEQNQKRLEKAMNIFLKKGYKTLRPVY